jgi:ADP-ribosylglycohydrolase
MAAAVATGLSPDGSIEAVVDTALALARDGTCLAIDAAIRAADPSDALSAFIVQTRDAISPYDPRADHVVDDPALTRTGLSNTGRPSRTASIEELPVALAALRYGDGDFFKTLRAAVYYGRDCDSIASMACCLYGAIYGVGVLPATLRAACDTANRRDFGAIADLFTGSVQAILGKDADRFANRQRALLSSASY